MLEVGRKYRDAMSEDRMVQPINTEGLCRVFFNAKHGQKHGDQPCSPVWQYVGKAHVPPSLFDKSWIGFTETYG